MAAEIIRFQTAPWIVGGHLQSLWSPLFRRQNIPVRQREKLNLPDGDFINLDWYGPEDGKAPLREVAIKIIPEYRRHNFEVPRQ